MKIWYELSLNSGIVEKVEVEKHTSKTVWVKRGYNFVRRESRFNSYTEFYPTFQEAKEAGKKYLERRLEEARKAAFNFSLKLVRLSELEETKVSGPPDHSTPLLLTAKDILESKE